MRILLALCLVLSALVSTALAKEWYEGGTLHSATVAQWQNAAEDNKVATCGDWIHRTTNKDYMTHLVTKEPELLHRVAQVLSACVTKSAEGTQGNLNASTLAVLCLSSFKETNTGFEWLLSRQ